MAFKWKTGDRFEAPSGRKKNPRKKSVGGTYGLHVIKFPSGRWGFVGTIPRQLGKDIPASTSAVMGGRAFFGPDKKLYETKFPTFDSEREAVEFANNAGFWVEQSNFNRAQNPPHGNRARIVGMVGRSPRRRKNPKTLADVTAETSGRFPILTGFGLFARKGKGPRMHFDGRKFTTAGKAKFFASRDAAEKFGRRLLDAHRDVLQAYTITVEELRRRGKA